MKLVKGVTRYVVLTKKWAFKIPSLYDWRLFLTGLLCNMQESEWSGHSEKLCPVKWHLPGGWLVVMPRCEPVTWEEINLDEFKDLPMQDHKECNFGRYKGRVVMIDYGS